MSGSSTTIGVIYVLMIILTLPLHLLIIWIVLRNKKFRKLTAYGIMVNMSFCECTLTIGHFMGGLMSVSQTTFHSYFQNVGGCFVCASWVGIVLFIFLLSLDRFLVFIGFNMTDHSEKRFFMVTSVLAWLTVFAIFMIHLLPKQTVVYNVSLSVYQLAMTSDTQTIYIEHMIIFFFLIVAFLLAMGTVIAIIVKRNIHSTHFKLNSGEARLLIQSAIIFAYFAVIRLAWHFAPYSEAVTIALGLATQAVGLLNPIVYLIFNASIRKHVLTALCVPTKVNIFHISTSTTKLPGTPLAT
uniref:G_PROTEIN_RECEP_F1_2 domain-containing protein n=1 Tax=Steinernema glaseri TaxID=37863 RepID=A0A1I8A845_9BILA